MAPSDVTTPLTVTGEPGRSSRTTYQRYRLSPDFYVTVYDDGRFSLTSLTHDVAVTSVNNFESGSGVEVVLTEKSR